MCRRWIVRGFFLLLILLCLAGWEWSGTHNSDVGYSHSDRWLACHTWDGVVGVMLGRGGRAWHYGMPDGWFVEIRPQSPAHFWPEDSMHLNSFLGFVIDDDLDLTGKRYELSVPYWFLILLSLAALFFVCRKTLPKVNPESAFPIEPTAPPKHP